LVIDVVSVNDIVSGYFEQRTDTDRCRDPTRQSSVIAVATAGVAEATMTKAGANAAAKVDIGNHNGDGGGSIGGQRGWH
jgi:hypothetical protein